MKKTETQEVSLEVKENIGVMSFYLALKFTQDLYNGNIHAFSEKLKDNVYKKNNQVKADGTNMSAKEIAQSKKKLKKILNDFKAFDKYSSDVLKVARLNPMMGQIFNKYSYDAYEEIEQAFHGKLLKYVVGIGHEVSNEEKKEKDERSKDSK